MKISELIEALRAEQAQRGDVEVYIPDGGCSLSCNGIERVGRVGPAAGQWGGSWGGRAPLVIEAPPQP